MARGKQNVLNIKRSSQFCLYESVDCLVEEMIETRFGVHLNSKTYTYCKISRWQENARPVWKCLIPDVLRSIIMSKLCWSRTISNVHLVHDKKRHAQRIWSQMFLYRMILDTYVMMKSHLESHCFHVFSHW